MRSFLLLGAGLPLLASASAGAADRGLAALVREFSQPTGQARTRVCYAIPRGSWSLDSLTRDLQHMQDAGFGGLWYLDGYEGHGGLYGDISYFSQEGAEEFMSPEHLRKLNLLLEEAHKRDLQIISPIRALWLTGGPWIDQDHAVKEYTLTKTYVTGAGPRRIRLPEPPKRKGYYRDAFVVAWPVEEGPLQTVMHRRPPKITVNQPESQREAHFLADGVGLTAMNRFGVTLLPFGPPLKTPEETVITYEFPDELEPTTCFIKLAPDKTAIVVPGTIASSSDGRTYRKLADFELRLGQSQSIALPKTKVRWFRVTFPPLINRETMGVEEIEFLQAGETPVARERIKNFGLKAARDCWDQSMTTDPAEYFGAAAYFESRAAPENGRVIRRRDVRVLPLQPDRDGSVEWDVPPGMWCVMRFGYTLARNNYVHARPGGAGYESDIYSAEASRLQYDNVPGRIVSALSPRGRQALQGIWCESFETGPTNWTPSLAEDFSRHTGYNIATWLPVLADEIVEGVEQSDAFLADFRATLHQLYADNFHGVMKGLCERDGLEWYSETGYTVQAHQDDMLYLRRTHVPSGEFWGGQQEIGFNTSITEFQGNALKWGTVKEVQGSEPWWAVNAWTKLPASASHVFGHSQRVAVEALTGSDFDFHRVPLFDKHVSDRAFCAGANQFYVSWWFNDKREGVYPGLHNWGWLNPRNPIFRLSSAFCLYLSRCQSLLQRGIFRADVLIGHEGAMHLTQRAGSQEWPKVYVPKGYDFDFLSRELVLEDLRVDDGALVLSSGMRYRVLHVPDFANRMSVEYLTKLEALLRAGAVVLAPKPVAGMSVTDYGDGSAEHRKLVERIWSGVDGKKVTSKGYGKGRLYWGASLDEVLEAEGVRPDFAYAGVNGPAYVDHIHRRIEASDIDFYFLANAVNEAAEIKARFRGQGGKVPYLFDPLSGEVRPIRQQRLADGDSEIVLTMEPVGSVFVVFAPGDAPRDTNQPMATSPTLAPIEIIGPWSVEFRDMFGESFRREFPELRSFHLSTDEQVKYFSGEASYRNTFTLPAGVLKDHRWYMDCGEVRWLAEIKVNGETAGIVWCPPWRMEVTQYLREGENELEIVSANPWKNRMIGESQLPPGERKVTLTNFRMSIEEFKKMELMEAGLLGPIRLVAALDRKLEK